MKVLVRFFLGVILSFAVLHFTYWPTYRWAYKTFFEDKVNAYIKPYLDAESKLTRQQELEAFEKIRSEFKTETTILLFAEKNKMAAMSIIGVAVGLMFIVFGGSIQINVVRPEKKEKIPEPKPKDETSATSEKGFSKKTTFWIIMAVLALVVVVNLNTYHTPSEMHKLKITVIGVILLAGFLAFSYGMSWFSNEIKSEAKKRKNDAAKEEILKAYGAKGWATVDQVKTALNNADTGLHIGAGFFFNDQGHCITVGGSRGGKGVNLILPALLANALTLDDAPSFIVLDPKGENIAVSGDYLKYAGYDVICINPFGIPEISKFGSASFNPFDLFNVYSPNFTKYVEAIAYAVLPPGQKENPYFSNAARDLLKIYIGHLMTKSNEPKTFTTLYNWLRLSGPKLDALLTDMAGNMALDGVIAAGAMSLIQQITNESKSINDVYSTATVATSVFGDLQLRESLSRSDFKLENISRRKTALFISVSPSDLNRMQVWLRVLLGSIIEGFTTNYGRKVVMLMDEFPTIGHLHAFEVASGFAAGYNVTLWPIMQDLTQLKNLYPNTWETFINNAIIRHYLSIGDNFTAEYISKRMPKIVKFVGNNADGSPREIQQPLLDVDGILSFDRIILEIKGMDRPAPMPKNPYWQRNNNGAPNPFRV